MRSEIMSLTYFMVLIPLIILRYKSFCTVPPPTTNTKENKSFCVVSIGTKPNKHFCIGRSRKTDVTALREQKTM